MMKRHGALLSVFLCALCASAVQAETQFQKHWLTAQFYAEGANTGDFNHDGKPDVVYGPMIWDGPEFTIKHNYTPGGPAEPLAYSQNFFAFVSDLNADGWDDIVIIGFPGAETNWYENPKESKSTDWKKHLLFKVTDNESPALINVVGDEKPELLCCTAGTIGYATPDASDATKEWSWHAVSPKADYQRFTHGLGVGDINGDGRLDLLEKNGWWEQPEKLDGNRLWKKHEFQFSGPGSAQTYAYDVDGDGDNDVITALHAHGYGLAWYENLKGDGADFKQHLILSPDPKEKMQGVQFSQLHAVDLVDMDGDGLKDIVTGKRYWAHGPHGDPDPEGLPVLYWFKLTREGGKANYEAKLIDQHTGVGTQVVAADINGDKKPDIIVGNKRGGQLMLSK
jgi:hypothetical protein